MRIWIPNTAAYSKLPNWRVRSLPRLIFCHRLIKDRNRERRNELARVNVKKAATRNYCTSVNMKVFNVIFSDFLNILGQQALLHGSERELKVCCGFFKFSDFLCSRLLSPVVSCMGRKKPCFLNLDSTVPEL